MYYITISNGLLEGDHQERMGAAVWLYMWLIDKVTRIDEDGLGYVLGGKPINYKDMKGFKERTAQRYLETLKEQGYVNEKRTPYGMILTITKAKKKFGRGVKRDTPKVADLPPERSAKSGGTDTPKVADHHDKSGGSNKTIAIDSSSKTPSSGRMPADHYNNVYRILEAFQSVNPHWQQLQDSKKQFDAAERMLKIHGIDLVLKIVKEVLPKSNRIKYVVTITTPVQLELKWADLAAGLVKEQAVKDTKKSNFVL